MVVVAVVAVVAVVVATAAVIIAAAAVVDVLLAPHRRRVECHFKIFMGFHYCHKGEISEAHKTFRFPYAIYHRKTAILKT